MVTPATDSPESTPRSTKASSDEDGAKRWLGVLIAVVALLVSVTTFLQTDASNRSTQFSHHAQENAIASTGARTRGQQEAAFEEFVMAREYDELSAEAKRLNENGDSLGARAYITASQETVKLSPLLSPSYTTFRASGLRRSDQNRFEVDTWVITATLLSERRGAAAQEANAWDGKSNNYVAAIAVFAVTLFLFGLASTLSGCVRWLFLFVGLGLATIASVWVLTTAVWPIHHISDIALQQFAQGYGYTWQRKYNQAIQVYNQAVKTDPEYANAYSERGLAWMNVQPPDVKKAIQDLETARNLAEDDHDVFWNLGWAYYLSGDYAHSISASQRSLDLNSKICGPSFNIAIARLVMGNGAQAEKDYDAAIARCEKILRDSLAAGLGAPSSLWRDIAMSAQDIENLLCQTHQVHCYDGREHPELKQAVNRDTILTVGEKYLKRLKEALTALEYQHTATVKPSGAKFTPQTFGYKFYDDNDEFQSYAVNDRFAYTGPNIYALWNYSGMNPDLDMVWKVYRNGDENAGLRYVGKWGLKTAGSAEKKINSWFLLEPGRYDVEVYGSGELLAADSFVIDEKQTLPIAPPSSALPNAPVNVANLVFSDDFANNNHGWWSGNANADVSNLTEGKIEKGEYVIMTHKKDKVWRVTCNDCGNLDDFYYEATSRYIQGPNDYGYGLAVRGNRGMDQMYLFVIDELGSYRIYKVIDGKYTYLTNWTRSTLVHPGQANRLGVLARGSSLEFFINGQSVMQVTDTSLAKGYIGLTVESDGLQVAFSQARVWQVR